VAVTEDKTWMVDSKKAQVVRLFEVPDPGVTNASLSTAPNSRRRSRRTRLPGDVVPHFRARRVLFARPRQHRHRLERLGLLRNPFHSEKGEKPDLIKLNLVFKGSGKVWVKTSVAQGLVPSKLVQSHTSQAWVLADAMNFTDELERLGSASCKGQPDFRGVCQSQEPALSGQPFAACYRGVAVNPLANSLACRYGPLPLAPIPSAASFAATLRAIFCRRGYCHGLVCMWWAARAGFSPSAASRSVFSRSAVARLVCCRRRGGAVGFFAVGGGAVGYYALGGGAVGVHTLDAAHRDPGMVNFFQSILPGTEK